MATIPYKIYLSEEEMPQYWYNMKAVMKEIPEPFINPATMKPCTAEDLSHVFCTELVKQELNTTDQYIEIPEEVNNFYKMYRPSPLVRAYCLEKLLDTPAEIYYKFEGSNTSGSHKLNSAAAQVYYAKKQGLKTLTTETGAGQWGTALSMACAYYNIDLTVYMVKISAEQKPHRKAVIETFGEETKTACEKYDIQPDIIIGCVGGGSNFAGLIAPFIGDKIQGKNDIRFIGVEPASCPSLTRGKYAYDFGDTGKTTPLMKMYTLGSGFMPSPNHAGGLRYHGMSSIVSKLYHDGYFEARSVEQTKVFEAATLFARCEGILSAPESAHAVRSAIDEALKCKETHEKKAILFGLTGTGYFDLSAYMSYNDGTMIDYIPTDEDLEKGFASLPKVR